MALSAARLGVAMAGAVAANATDRAAAFEALAQAIIDEITTYAAVAVTVTSVTGVTTGGGVSGPGTGTGTVS